MEPINNKTIDEIFHASPEVFEARLGSMNLNWRLLLAHVQKNPDLLAKARASNWNYFERFKGRKTLTEHEFQLVTINALNILSRLDPSTATNGLVYGEVQSGKTTSMTVLTALAFDLGFKAVISLSGRINILRNQTQTRTQESLHGDLRSSPPTSTNVTPDRKRKRDENSDDYSTEESSETDNEEEYEDGAWSDLGDILIDLNGAMDANDYMFWLTRGDEDVQNIKNIDVDELLQSTKLFAVLKKVPKSLESFVSFIEGDLEESPWQKACKKNPEIKERLAEIKRKLAEFLSGPALIIDDECDDASVANNAAKAVDQRGIPEKIRCIRKLWSSFGQNVCHYVGYSATPQANVLNASSDEFFPHFLWELPTQTGAYLGSQMYVNEELKNRIIKLIPYRDYPNLDLCGDIAPAVGKRARIADVQMNFLATLLSEEKATPSMKKFLAYYVFSGAIRAQQNSPTRNIDGIIANLQGTRDPLSFFANGDENATFNLREDLKECLDNSNEPYHSQSPRQLRDLFVHFHTNYCKLFYEPCFKQPIILAKIEELISCRIILYIATDAGKINTVRSNEAKELGKELVYILYYKNNFYRLDKPIEEPKPEKPLFHSAMVHASLSINFIERKHSVVSIAWSIVKRDIANQLNTIKEFDYLDEVWQDLSPNVAMTQFKPNIEEVLKKTQIKTAMSGGGESSTNMRKFDYSVAEGDYTSKNRPVPRFLIVIGGNMLSRGLTIEGLTVSWYTRTAKESVVDTTIQHQRWFGWRHGYINLVRVFMQERNLEVFTEAVKCEHSLRNVFKRIARLSLSPSKNSVVLRRPASGRLTNKNRGHVKNLEMGDYQHKTPALDPMASRAVLDITVDFWQEISVAAKAHYAGEVVMDVPVERVLEYIETVESVGMPNAMDLVERINIYLQICKESRTEPTINVGIPTRSDVSQVDLKDFDDPSSHFVIENGLGLHNRGRNLNDFTKVDKLLGGKGMDKKARGQHCFIDAVVNMKNELPEWITTLDTDNTDEPRPYNRGPTAPLLLLIYFLHPRFINKHEGFYQQGAPEAGEVPLVGLAGCFPRVYSKYVVNSTVKTNDYVYPEADDDDTFERQRKRAKYSEPDEMDYIDFSD